MFEIGWTEMLVIAVVMIVVVGPKDLPKMLRTFGRTAAKLRSMAGDFQKQFNEALKEAELDDVKKSVDSLRSLNPANEIKKSLNPFEKAANEVRAGLQTLQNPPKPAEPASTTAVAAEPLKNGATVMPGAEPAAAASPAPDAAPVSSAPVGNAAATATASAAAAAPAAAKAPRKTAAKASAKVVAATPKSAKSTAGAKASAEGKPGSKSRKTAGSAT